LPTRSATGQLSFEVSRLRELLRPGVTALIVINFPHNPTGCVLSRAELAEVVALAREAGAVIFSDGAYDIVARLCALLTAVLLPARDVSWIGNGRQRCLPVRG